MPATAAPPIVGLGPRRSATYAVPVQLQRRPAVLLALCGGLVVATQARINAQFGAEVGHPTAGALLSAATGLAIVTIFAVVSGPIRAGLLRIPALVRRGALPWWALLMGTLGGFLLFSQTYSVPALGVAVYSVLIVASITGAGMLVDRIGLGPAGRQQVTTRRAVGAGLAVAAALVSAGPDLSTGSFALGAALVAVVAGAGGATQSALLGRVGSSARQPIAATWVNFVGATLILALATAAATARGASWTPPPPGWVWLGGPLGLVIVLTITVTVPRAGVLLVTLAITAGQLLGSLLWDWVAPVSGREVDVWAVTGAALLMVAVSVASGVGRTRAATTSGGSDGQPAGVARDGGGHRRARGGAHGG